MKRIRTLLGSSLGVTLLWLCVAAAAAQFSVNPAPKGLDPKVVEAWQKAGSQFGWYRPKDEADWYAPAGGGLFWW